MKIIAKRSIALILLLVSLLLTGCSSINQHTRHNELPVLTQDELIRPHIKLGRIQITREVYGSDYSLSPDIKAWGLDAMRQEAEKMGADAVTLPEITGRTTTNGIFPSTEYVATAFAIKFK